MVLLYKTFGKGKIFFEIIDGSASYPKYLQIDPWQNCNINNLSKWSCEPWICFWAKNWLAAMDFTLFVLILMPIFCLIKATHTRKIIIWRFPKKLNKLVVEILQGFPNILHSSSNWETGISHTHYFGWFGTIMVS